MSARGDRTREHLLDTAEQLFAERGIAGVSLREVRLAAGARNTAAMQFHFGDRDGLFVALTERHMPRIAQIQQTRYDQTLAHVSGEDPRGLVEVLVRPVADYLTVGPSQRAWVQIMGDLASQPDLHLKEMISVTPEAGLRAGMLLHRQLTRTLPDALARERIIILAQASVHLTADHARLLDDPVTSRRHATTDEFVTNLVDMLTAALFAAPSNGPTTSHRRRPPESIDPADTFPSTRSPAETERGTQPPG
jgi:AcrR family transcriptional regulator